MPPIMLSAMFAAVPQVWVPTRELAPNSREYRAILAAARSTLGRTEVRIGDRADVIRRSGAWAFATKRLGSDRVSAWTREWAVLLRRTATAWRSAGAIVGVQARAKIARDRWDLNPRLFAEPKPRGL